MAHVWKSEIISKKIEYKIDTLGISIDHFLCFYIICTNIVGIEIKSKKKSITNKDYTFKFSKTF